MSQTNVSSCVLAIVASFTSGLDVFKNFRERRNKKKQKTKKSSSVDYEEVRLVKSLRQGPEDIAREYRSSIHSVGEGFAHGDGIAQTSLAEILLRLNTGLVTIISTFLARNKNDIELDLRSLASLSERSRIDTCRTLRQLHSRMVHARLPAELSFDDDLVIADSDISSESPQHRKARRKHTASPKQTRTRGPAVARVVVANSSKASQLALVRPGERKKKPHLRPTSPKQQSSASIAARASINHPQLHAVPDVPYRPSNMRTRTTPNMPGIHPKPSENAMSDLSLPVPEHIRSGRSALRLNSAALQQHQKHSMLNTTPLRAVAPDRKRPAVPTYYSIETTSTRLGEIPLHKWADSYDFDAMSSLNREAEMNGWPLNDFSVDAQQGKKKGPGLFGLFRRNKTPT